MLNFVPVLVALILACENSAQNFGTCDYRKYLSPGDKDVFHNPNYPNLYTPGWPCRWTISSDRPIKLVCSRFELPATRNCNGDAINIADGLIATHQYCGNGPFTLVSETNTLVITLTSWVYSNGGRFTCSVETVSTDNCDCGWTNSMRIAGGSVTGVNEFPMMAVLVDANSKAIFCGATIINTKQVLTAAHCVRTQNIYGFVVIVGEHDTTTGFETTASKAYMVDSFRVHSEYDRTTSVNDIAVVTVTGEIEFSQQVGPVCLPFRGMPNIVGSLVSILGWGHYATSSPLSDKLQQAAVSVIANTKCHKTYKDLTDKQMCTQSDYRDSCQFDSGGPVLWRNPSTGRIIEVGIISLGGACASEIPAANTRVSSYVNWIVANTPEGIMNCGRGQR